MSLVNDSIPNFIGGVSQQPDKIMYPNQAKDLVNYYLNVSDGLQKRPPTEHIAKLMNSLSIHPKVYTIIKEGERYIVMLTGSTIKVFDFLGNEKTVTIESGSLDYITSSSPLTDFDVATIGDYTFITNKTKVVRLSNTLSPNPQGNSAIVFIKQADFGVSYTVKVNNTSVSYSIDANQQITNTQTNKSESYDESYSMALSNNDVASTITVASSLAGQLSSRLGSGWTITRVGSTIQIKKNDGSDFSLTVTDTNGNNNSLGYHHEANTMSTLPIVAPDGFILKVVGEKVEASDDYYVKFKTTDEVGFGSGTWVETVAPNIKYKLDASTMPHGLVRNSDGTFTFKALEWADRQAGDEDLAPSPSFIDNTIQEVFTHKGRLAFISEDKTIYSDTEDIFSFFKQSTLAELDTDPIDVKSNSTMVNLKHALAFNEVLLLFSPTTEFTLKGGDVFSNSTVAIDLSMKYQCSPDCKPVNVGNTGFFIFENGEYSKMMEVFVTSTYNLDAREVTEQVPSYIPKDVYKIASSTANNLACLLTTEKRDTIYCYNYYYSSSTEQKAQSAWHKWIFDNAQILNADFDDNWLYIVAQYSDGVYLQRMNFSHKNKEQDLDYLFFLDRKVYLDSSDLTYNSSIDKTSFTLPYALDNELTVLESRGFPLDYEISNTTVSVDGEYTNLIIGNVYDSKWTMGKIFVRQQSSGGGIKVKEGLLMLRDINLSYANSGYFKVKVTPKYTTAITSTFEFTGKITGLISSQLEQIPVSDGTFLIPIASKNDEITIEISNDSYLPSNFLSLDWLGDFIVRGQ